MSDNCPYTQSRIYEALTILQAIRENQDCALELDRLNTPDCHEILDDTASAIAYAAQAYEKLKGAKIGYGQTVHSDGGR
jgi:hypothetical protein